MGIDVDFIAGDNAIKRISELLSDQPHMGRKRIADEIIEFESKMQKKYGDKADMKFNNLDHDEYNRQGFDIFFRDFLGDKNYYIVARIDDPKSFASDRSIVIPQLNDDSEAKSRAIDFGFIFDDEDNEYHVTGMNTSKIMLTVDGQEMCTLGDFWYVNRETITNAEYKRVCNLKVGESCYVGIVKVKRVLRKLKLG